MMKLLQEKKRFMALAGVVMTVYLIFHMLTNLSFFSAPAFTAFLDGYNQPWIRWPILALVLASLALHVYTAVIIRIKNSQARKVGYKKHDKLHIPASLVSLSVAFLLFFILVHIAQTLTMDISQPVAVMTQWFSSVWLLLFYLAGLFVLAMHLQHSLVNVLQTLGKTSAMYQSAIISAVVVVMLGFASVPVYIWMNA
jgi:succinate dehydrogenase / fumarate reductase cytochrome b subunit